MNGNSNLPERLAALEQTVAGKHNALFKLLGLFGVLLLACNLWLISQARTSRRQSEIEHQFWVIGHGVYSHKARAEAFLGLVAVGNKEWRGAHLDWLNLQGVALPNADLQGADFKGSDLRNATLTGAKFAKAKLPQTDLTDADLSGADLAGVDLLQAQLRGAQLRRANLRGAILEQVQAPDAILVAADLSDAYLLMADLTGANLSAADLGGASLEAAILRGANLSLARLNNVNLKDADFSDANWWRARGLSSEQLARLLKKFPPGEESPAAWREDYEAWLKTMEPAK